MTTGFTGGNGSASNTGVKTGWTVGGGGEVALTPAVSVKLEYLYMDFGSMTVVNPVTNTPEFAQTMRTQFDLAMNVVRLGLNYRF